MRRTIGYFLLALPLFGAWCPPVRADGGLVRLSEQLGRYRVTVFTGPTPLRVGWVDVSVFVQDAATGAPVADVDVVIDAAPTGRPDQSTHYPATQEAATNKLFQAALFEIAQAGQWQLSITVAGPAGKFTTRFEVEVADALPSIDSLVWWIGWPILPLFLFGIHQYLVWRRLPGRRELLLGGTQDRRNKAQVAATGKVHKEW